MMNDSEKWEAVISNDKNYDGKFYYAVKSTGIFCRPSCASRTPKQDNVLFFDSADEAVQNGFRPCKRCRPDLIEYDPAADLAAEAKELIERGFGDRAELQDKLNVLGVTRRHLTDIFEQKYGLSPDQYIAQVRLNKAKKLLLAGTGITDTAFTVSMDSASAFSSFFKKHVGISPSEFVAKEASDNPYRIVKTAVGIVRIEEDASGISSLQFVNEPGEKVKSDYKGLYLDDAESQVLEYFEGKRKSFDLPLSLKGSEFQRTVWEALQEIPYGETRNYQEVAAAIGNAKAARAVGMANNRNPILIIIPCHRVIGKTGNPVGYAGGIERKQFFLRMEAERK